MILSNFNALNERLSVDYVRQLRVSLVYYVHEESVTDSWFILIFHGHLLRNLVELMKLPMVERGNRNIIHIYMRHDYELFWTNCIHSKKQKKVVRDQSLNDTDNCSLLALNSGSRSSRFIPSYIGKVKYMVLRVIPRYSVWGRIRKQGCSCKITTRPITLK